MTHFLEAFCWQPEKNPKIGSLVRNVASFVQIEELLWFFTKSQTCLQLFAENLMKKTLQQGSLFKTLLVFGKSTSFHDFPQNYTLCSELITHLPSVLFLPLGQQHWSDLSRAQAWAKTVEILSCPVLKTPSRPRRCGPKECRAVRLAPGWLQELPESVGTVHWSAFGAPLLILKVYSPTLGRWICPRSPPPPSLGYLKLLIRLE